MRKTANILYISICLLLVILPFAGMTVAPTVSTTENREMAVFPELVENGFWNREYLQEMGEYFEDHFAFRPVLVTIDSVIQSRVFGVSSMDTVTVGKSGWLYYTATLDDYIGEHTLSERGIYNAAHNLSLVQQYTEEKGAAFLLAIPPNKNSLYGENMPYYIKQVSTVNNMALLQPELSACNVNYADLSATFKREKESLYLKRDSHWNWKGAVLAYHTMLTQLECGHDSYETTGCIRTKTEYGDLNKMLYPSGFAPEWNYNYQKEHTFTYVTETDNVEDAWIETENPEGEGSLLMFRDSFGNTLLPLMADVFDRGYFSKTMPYNLEEYLNRYSPEYVIVEKVERNIDEFAQEPPVMTGPLVNLEKQVEKMDSRTTLDMEQSEYNAGYWAFSGILDESLVKPDSDIYIRVTAEDETDTYAAFSISSESSDNGYLLYVQKEQLPFNRVAAEVLVKTGDKLIRAAREEFEVTGSMEENAVRKIQK